MSAMTFDQFEKIILERGFEKEPLNAYDELRYYLNFGEIQIRIDSSKSAFDMFYACGYYDINKNELVPFDAESEMSDSYSNVIQDIEKFWVIRELNRALSFHISTEYDDCGGMCPGSTEWVGLFDCALFDASEKIIDDFIKSVNIGKEKTNIKGLTILQKANFVAKNLLYKYGCTQHDLKDGVSFWNDLLGITIFANSTNNSEEVSKILHTAELDSNDLCWGNEYLVLKKGMKTFGIDLSNLSGFFELCSAFGCDNDIEFYLDDSHSLPSLTLKSIYWIGLFILSESAVIPEAEYLHHQTILNKLTSFVSDSFRSRNIGVLNFSLLKPAQFEQLCYDYLIEEEYENVTKFASSNTADGGIDITAIETVQTKLTTEKRKYLVQCKHSKKSLSRKDIGEIQTLLREQKADIFLLICSNFINPQAINRMELQKSQGVRIEYWGVVEFSTRLAHHPELVKKYCLGGVSV